MSSRRIRVRRCGCTSIKALSLDSHELVSELSMSTASTLCQRHQVAVLLSEVDFAARGNLRSHQTRTLLQWVFRLNVLSLVWPEFWKLRDSTVDDMHTCSLKALHVGAYAVCHMTANIRLMSCSRSRVDEHVLFDIGCLASRRDRNGLSVATDMDDEAPDQDRSRRSRWFTAWPREVYHLGSRENFNRQGESCALVTFSTKKGCVMLCSSAVCGETRRVPPQLFCCQESVAD